MKVADIFESNGSLSAAVVEGGSYPTIELGEGKVGVIPTTQEGLAFLNYVPRKR